MNETIVCRLCLYDNDDYYNIFGNKLRESNTQQKIQKYLYLEIKENDNLPKLICLRCLEKLENFHIFYETVAQNQTVFNYQSANENEILPNCENPIESSEEYIKLEVSVEDIPNNILVENLTNNSCMSISEITVTDDLTNDILNDNIENKHRNLDSLAIEKAVKGSKKKKLKRLKRKVSKKVPEPQVNIKSEDESDFDSDASINFDYSSLSKNDEDDDEMIYNYHENSNYANFPKKIIHDSKLLIRGKALVNLMSKFYRLECNVCPSTTTSDKKTSFKSMASLCNHYYSVHAMKGYVICCDVKLVKPKAMAMHMSRHLQPDAFKCPECGKMMTCPKILQYHIQNHLPEEKRPLPCPDCPRRFSYSSALVAHAISHQPENERAAHICDECGKTFSSPGRLSTHINVAHTRHDQEFVCHVCAKQFTCRGNLVYHLTTHQPRVHQMQCEQCGKWLKNKLCLRKHMVQHSLVRYHCNTCDYSALNSQCLKNHIKVQHSDIKPFSCDVCGKTFKLKNTLINHMVQHTGVRKFACQFCSRTFASSGNYYSHRKRMHPIELAEFKLKQEEEEKKLRAEAMLIKSS